LKGDNKQLQQEKELMVSKFWNAENLSQQLHDMNRQLFTEIDGL
jgi:hypothetical protein